MKRRRKIKNRKKIILIVVSFVLLLTLLYLFFPFFKLKGSSEVNVEVNQKYIEKGYITNGKIIDVFDDIDTKKIGKYHVYYKYLFKNKIKTKIRIVNIVDTTAPVLNLKGNEKIDNCAKSYIEEGYTAIDNYDGDITSKVNVTKEKNKIIYKVVDSSSNSSTVERVFTNVDKEKPTIILSDRNYISLKINNEYKEPGFNVIDNCDEDLTKNVEITNNIDISKEGTYEVKYRVVDSSNNESVAIRKVMVYTPKSCFSSQTVGKKGTIYLTFDDGPSLSTTNKLLDILKEENIKATFFITDKTNTDYLIKRMYDENHTIGLHTASHNYKQIYSSVDNYFKDLEKIRNKVKRVTGYSPTIIRFPGGSSNTVSNFNPGIMCELSNLVIEKGYHYFDWNISSGDATNKRSKSNTYKNVVNNLSKSRANIVLMHDIYGSTVEAVKDIIKYGKENGYTFEKITMDTPMYTHVVNNR